MKTQRGFPCLSGNPTCPEASAQKVDKSPGGGARGLCSAGCTNWAWFVDPSCGSIQSWLQGCICGAPQPGGSRGYGPAGLDPHGRSTLRRAVHRLGAPGRVDEYVIS